jgi:hypothetical protein
MRLLRWEACVVAVCDWWGEIMFGFAKELIAHWPQPSWGLLGVCSALVAVLPIRLLDYSAAKRRPSADITPADDLSVQPWSVVANAPTVEVHQVDACAVDVIAIGAVVPVQAATGTLRIHRPKPGLKGRPLQAFRQAPLKAKRAKPSKARGTYNARNATGSVKRAAPHTRIIKQSAQRSTVKRMIGNVVHFPGGRTRSIASTSVKRAA